MDARPFKAIEDHPGADLSLHLQSYRCIWRAKIESEAVCHEPGDAFVSDDQVTTSAVS